MCRCMIEELQWSWTSSAGAGAGGGVEAERWDDGLHELHAQDLAARAGSADHLQGVG